jgi:hypothetical protein
MVLVRDRRAEQREDAAAGRLHDVTVVAPHRVDHQLERRIENRARLLGVQVLLELCRSLDFGEQRRDRLALTLCRERFKRRVGAYSNRGTRRLVSGHRCSGGGWQRGTAISTELLLGRIVPAALGASICQRGAAVPTKPLARRIFGSTLRALHCCTQCASSKFHPR